MPEQLRILMVAPQPFFRPRGTPFSVVHRIRALTRLGHEVDLVTYPFGDDPDIDGLTIFRSAKPPLVDDVRIGPSPAKIVLDIPLLALTRRMAGTGKYDVLHTHEEAGLVGHRMARKNGLPHIYDMHSSLPQQFSNFGRYNWRPVVSGFRWMERMAVLGSVGVIVVYRELQEHVRSLGYDGPLALIENTLDFERPSPNPQRSVRIREELGIGNRPVVLYTGTLEHYQGMDLLVEAAAALGDRGRDIMFVSVGGTEEQIAGLKGHADRMNLSDRFVFIPMVSPDKVFHFHDLADALITCRARGTNIPLKIYQYLRAGKPIIATAIESHTQVLDETVAELVPPTAEGIARGIERVVSDQAHALQLATAAGELAAQRYSEEHYMRTLEDFMGSLALGRTGPSASR